jgi:hypothetical protein
MYKFHDIPRRAGIVAREGKTVSSRTNCVNQTKGREAQTKAFLHKARKCNIYEENRRTRESGSIYEQKKT